MSNPIPLDFDKWDAERESKASAPAPRSGFSDREPRKTLRPPSTLASFKGQLQQADKSGMTAVRDLARSAFQGPTLGFGDNIEAGIRTGFGMLGDYDGTLKQIRSEMNDVRQQHPVVSFGAEVLGGSPAAALKALPGGAFVKDAVAGGVSALGAGDGNASAGDFGVGVGVAGGVGAAVRGLGALTSGGAHAVDAMRNPERAAAGALSRALGDGTEARAAMAGLDGVPATVADAAGTTAKRIVRGAKARGGVIGNEIADAVGERRAGAAERVVERVKKGLGGDAEDVVTAKEELVAKLKGVNDEGYKAVRARGAKLEGPELAAVLDDPATQKAWGRVSDINARLRRSGEDAVTLPSLDEVLAGGKLDIGAADELKRGLDDIIKNGYDGTTLGGLKGNEARSLVKLKDKLVSLADAADDKARGTTGGPSYREVRATAEKGYKGVDALAEGDGFLTLPPKEFATKWKAMSPDEQQLYLLGARTKLIDRLGQSDGARDRTRGLLGSPNFKAKVKTMLGPDADNFLQGLDAERTLADTDNFIRGGSNTVDKLADSGPDVRSWSDAIRALSSPKAAGAFAVSKGVGALDRLATGTTGAGGDLAAQQLMRPANEIDDVLAYLGQHAKNPRLAAFDAGRGRVATSVGAAAARGTQRSRDDR